MLPDMTNSIPGRIRGAAMAGMCMAILFAGGLWAQAPAPLQQLGVPETATSLEGQPQVRVETTETGAIRLELDAREAAASRLTITVRNGRLYWGADEQPLLVNPAGEFVYLSSTQPGRYVRLRRLNDRIAYVEHVDMGQRAITYWGELRVFLGK
jgi:hypothetical protein